MRQKTIAVIIVAAGKGERASVAGSPEPKQYRKVGGRPVLAWTIDAFLSLPYITSILPVIHPDHADRYAELGFSNPRLLAPVFGAATRQASVLKGLEALAPCPPDIVLIHDAARPFVYSDLVGDVVAVLETYDGVLPALTVTDTIKRSLDGRHIVGTEDRNQLFAAQTRQGFGFDQILSAHPRASTIDRQFTDHAETA